MTDKRRVALTDTRLKNLNPAAKGQRYALADTTCPGLKVRINDKGKGHFILWRRMPGAKHPSALSLGEVGTVTLIQAREKARSWLAQIKQGDNPKVLEAKQAEEKRRAEAEEKAEAEATFGKAVRERYFPHIERLRDKKKIKQVFEHDLLPGWEERPVLDIARKEIKQRLKAIARRTSSQAFTAGGYLITFYNWLREEDDIEGGVPTDGMKLTKVLGHSRRYRERVLSDDELFAFWDAVRPERWEKRIEKGQRLIRGKMQNVSTICPDRAVNGIHLLMRWDADCSAASLLSHLRTVLAAAGYKEGTGGIAEGEIEIFPKQSQVREGGYGNLVAVPFGRKSIPLDSNFEPAHGPLMWLSSAPVSIPEKLPASYFPSADQKEIQEALADALKYVLADDYRLWICVGIALKLALGEHGFKLFNTWSSTSNRYEGASDTRKYWDQFKPREGGVTIGSVFYWAQQNGWKPTWNDGSEQQFGEFTDVLAHQPDGGPFPSDALPPPFRQYVANRAAAMQVRPDLIAAPLLAVAATMLGRDWRIRPEGRRSTWTEPAILWVAAVAESGSMKSAAAREATKFVQQMQLKFRAEYQSELAAWKSAKQGETDAGPKPLLESCYVADTTVESLKQVLSDDHNRNPRGILSDPDELAGWFNSLNQYKAKGNDRQIYLSLYDGGMLRIDRKNDGDPLVIARTGLSIVGGVQPAIVQSLFRRGDDGLTPRFQIAWPQPYGEVKLQRIDLDKDAFHQVTSRLSQMRDAMPIVKDEEKYDSHCCGETLVFDDAAQSEFDGWCVAIRNRKEQGVFGSYVEKERGLLARLSMILHGMRYGSEMGSKPIDLGTLRRAMSLVEYFESHARKLYGVVDAHPARAGALKIAHWIRRKRRTTFTPRDIRQNDWSEFSKEQDDGAILASLRYLEARGWLRIDEKVPGRKGGRPTLTATVNPAALEN